MIHGPAQPMVPAEVAVDTREMLSASAAYNRVKYTHKLLDARMLQHSASVLSIALQAHNIPQSFKPLL